MIRAAPGLCAPAKKLRLIQKKFHGLSFFLRNSGPAIDPMKRRGTADD